MTAMGSTTYLPAAILIALAELLPFAAAGQLLITPIDTTAIEREIRSLERSSEGRACLRGDVDTVITIPWLSLKCATMEDKPLTQRLFRSVVKVNPRRERVLWWFEREVPWVYSYFLDETGQVLASTDGGAFFCSHPDERGDNPNPWSGLIGYLIENKFESIYHVGCVGIHYYYAVDSAGVAGILNTIAEEPSGYEFTPLGDLPE